MDPPRIFLEMHDPATPHYVAILPFVILLSAIALLPVIRSTSHWWESNLHRFYVAGSLAALTVLYYATWHPAAGLSNVKHLLTHALVEDYIPFIVLLFSLYTIAGGIRITGNLAATPKVNTGFLFAGSLLASFIGTTGAAMLLIRPLLETNAERKNEQLIVNVALLTPYYLLDRLAAYPQEDFQDVRRDADQKMRLQFLGIIPNAILLGGIVLCVALLNPDKKLPILNWRPPPHLREIIQLLLVAISLQFGSAAIRKANRFNYHAIVEVAVLFIGIFLCMQPALEILRVRGAELGLEGPHSFFWATGTLSSVLDNAPTYLVFLETAAASPRFAGHAFHELVSQSGELADEARRWLIAISVGAVFMGAMTYIGNGPNFMVTAIAQRSGVAMPSFFGYTLRYAIPLLIPIFLFANWIVLS